MDANPVVPNRINRDHVSMVLKLFRERIGQAGKAAIVHPHRQVLPLNI